jgi:hypothetical protein
MEEDDQTSDCRQRRPSFDRPPEADRVDPKLSLEECVERRATISAALSEIAESIESIKGQIESSQVSEEVTGVSANPEWSRRAVAALRYYTRQHQDHQRALGNLNRRAIQLGQSGGKQAGRKAFIRHARTLLPAETYDAIWSRVDAELRGAEGARAA